MQAGVSDTSIAIDISSTERTFANLQPLSVLAGPSSIDLASKIATQLNAHLVVPEIRVFSDGESKVRFPPVTGACIVVQSTYPPTDTHLLQLMMLSRKCIEYGSSSVCAVVPYLAYARQDKAFLEGELATISLIAKLFAAAGIKSLITVDMHSQAGISKFSSVDVVNVSAVPFLAQYASGMGLRRPIAVSPDAGGEARAKEFAGKMGIESIALKKTRNRSTGEVTIESPQRDLSGRDAILVDDMISSGGSIIAAAGVLRHNGAARIYAMCSHALLLGDAADKIIKSGVDDIIATNSIPNKYAKVDVSSAISRTIQERYGPQSK
jgi:ribose-phosphate pyrophosphokinase